jgi:hypothetical protein
MRAQRKMIKLFTRKSREVVCDEEMNFPFVRSAVTQQVLQLCAIRRLRALALCLEPFEYLLRRRWALDLLARSDHVKRMKPV